MSIHYPKKSAYQRAIEFLKYRHTDPTRPINTTSDSTDAKEEPNPSALGGATPNKKYYSSNKIDTATTVTSILNAIVIALLIAFYSYVRSDIKEIKDLESVTSEKINEIKTSIEVKYTEIATKIDYILDNNNKKDSKKTELKEKQ